MVAPGPLPYQIPPSPACPTPTSTLSTKERYACNKQEKVRIPFSLRKRKGHEKLQDTQTERETHEQEGDEERVKSTQREVKTQGQSLHAVAEVYAWARNERSHKEEESDEEDTWRTWRIKDAEEKAAARQQHEERQ